MPPVDAASPADVAAGTPAVWPAARVAAPAPRSVPWWGASSAAAAERAGPQRDAQRDGVLADDVRRVNSPTSAVLLPGGFGEPPIHQLPSQREPVGPRRFRQVGQDSAKLPRPVQPPQQRQQLGGHDGLDTHSRDDPQRGRPRLPRATPPAPRVLHPDAVDHGEGRFAQRLITATGDVRAAQQPELHGVLEALRGQPSAT